MYSVYAENGSNSRVCIFSDTVDDVSLKLVSPNLSLSAGTAGSFSFTAISQNAAYSKGTVRRLTTTIIVERDDEEIWRGRPITDKDNFAKEREVTCEGALAFLNDSRVQPTMSVGSGKITISPNAELSGDPYILIGKLLEAHNRQVPENRKIYAGAKPSAYISASVKSFKPNFETTLDIINSKIVGELGGMIEVKYEPDAETPGLYLYYYSTYPENATQTIEFGKNLIDFTRNWNTDEFVTAVFPKGAKIEQETTSGSSSGDSSIIIVDPNQPAQQTTTETEKAEEYVSIAGRTTQQPGFFVNGPILENTTAIANYGYILGYLDYSDTENPADLLTDAENYMQHVQFDDLELELSALDLHVLGIDDPFNLLNVVMVSSYPHGFAPTSFSILGEDIPLDRFENTRYTMGSSTVAYKRRARTLTQKTRQTVQDLNGRVDDANDRIDETNDYVDETAGRLTSDLNDEIGARQTGDNNTLTQARQDIADYMGSISEGYVFIDHTATTTQGIYITSQPVTQYSELAQCQWYWGWNSQGLAHFSYGQQTGIALTSDGKINADMILTGELLVDYVRLYNEMAVYDGTGVYAGIGGYIGYGAGFDGTSVTYGIRMHTTTGEMIVTNSGARMSCGNVGFFVNDTYGSINATLYASDFQATSDRNAKKNIEYDPEKYRLLFDALRPCSFEYKTDNTGTRHTGFIAQDVEDVLAESGLTLEDFGCISKRTVVDPKTQEKHIEYSLGYNEFISLCVDQIHMLKQRVTDLEAKING